MKKAPNCNSDEFLMYDFTVEEGDTIYCGVSFGFAILPVLMTVGTVKRIWIEGVPKKLISVSYQTDPFFPPIGMQWVEGVGEYLRHPFYSLDCFNCGEVSFNFNCMKLNERLIFSNFFTFNPCSPTIDTIYVNKNLTRGDNNGLNWGNAFFNLQDALGIADSGDVVLVAQGTYLPTVGNDRAASFLLPNGVSLIGGFAGDETALDQRDFEANQTILCGEIGMPDENADNSYHVLYSLGADNATLIDGFIIEKGMADHPSFSNPDNKGGGFYIGTNDLYPVADPKINNCVFRDNTAKQGGAIYCDGRVNYMALSNVSNCSFFYNSASSEGGAIYKKRGRCRNGF